LTINSANQGGEGSTKGTIVPGKIADLIIIDQNPLHVDIMQLKHIKILETIKNGKTVYSSS